MTLDPGQPTREVDLQHAPEVFFGGLALLAFAIVLITVGWTGALALAMATLILACPKPLEPPQ